MGLRVSGLRLMALLKLLRASIVLLACMVLITPTAAAHGGGGKRQLNAHPLGEHFLHVWTSPALARVGEVHVEVLVTDADGDPLQGQRVIIAMSPQDESGEPLKMVAASNNAVTQRFWQLWASAPRQEAAFSIESTGSYEVEITVLDPSGQGGKTSFPLSVTRANGWLIVLLQGAIPLATLGLSWLMVEAGLRVWQRRKQAQATLKQLA